MQKINVSVVSYSNSVPFVYGLLNSEIINEINLSLDVPSVCADKLLTGKADIGLIPSVELLKMDYFEIISNQCIGANGVVKTVILASNAPVQQLEEIHLDYQSRTSVVLMKILAEKHWHISPKWVPASKGFETGAVHNKSGAVIIGDRTFSVASAYRYDLANEWKQLTGLPFVFAAWAANKPIPDDFKIRFDKALEFGTTHLPEAVAFSKNTINNPAEIIDYLQNNISYCLDSKKKEALNLFHSYARNYVCSPENTTQLI